MNMDLTTYSYQVAGCEESAQPLVAQGSSLIYEETLVLLSL